MRIKIQFYSLCLFCFLDCQPPDLCNAADTTSTCGILQSTLQNPNTANLPSVPHCSICRMFVTALPYNANLGGIVGADNKCSTASNKPSSGTYKALIVDDVNRRACTSVNCTSGGVTEQIDWVLAPNTTYVQAIDTSKTIFISNANGVNTNNLTDVISPASTGIWTGIRNNPSWDWLTYSGFTCSSWTDGVTTTCGSYGVTSWTDSRSISIYTVTAGGPTQYNLLCVEQ